MAGFFAEPANRAAITGRFKDFPDEQRAKLTLTCYYPTFNERGQASQVVPIAADGSFRVDLEEAFPMREVMLRGPIGNYRVVLAKGVDVTFVSSATGRPNLELAGPDEGLNDAVRRFAKFCDARDPKLRAKMYEAARRAAKDFEGGLAELAQAKKDSEEALRSFDAGEHAWLLQHQIEADYVCLVLEAAMLNKQPILERPVWAEIIAFRAYLLNSSTTAYYRYLGMYLTRMEWPAGERYDPADLARWAERRLPAASPATKEAYRTYRELMRVQLAKDETIEKRQARLQALAESLHAYGGLLSAEGGPRTEQMVAHFRTRVPEEKLDLVLLANLHTGAAELTEAYEVIRDFAGSRWPRLLLDRLQPVAATQLASERAAILVAKEAAPAPADAPTTDTVLGVKAEVLKSGARLYALPDADGPTIIARLKRAFPGRTLVIDFWGPWCTPCMEDLPFSEKMHASVADLPVEFVYLGCRTSDTAWRDTIAKLGLSGTHVLLTRAQDAELMASFGNEGYPSYVVIDRLGTVRSRRLIRLLNLSPHDFRAAIE